jgi:hypothetical protein
MKNKNTVKDIVTHLESTGKSPDYIIGTLMAMLDGLTYEYSGTAQQTIDSYINHHLNPNTNA